jgi:hypothetical protein
MKHFVSFVNLLFYYRVSFETSPFACQLLDFVDRFIGEANYSKALQARQGLFKRAREILHR